MTDSILIAILSIPNGISPELFYLLSVHVSDEQLPIMDCVEDLGNGTFRLPEGWTKDVL